MKTKILSVVIALTASVCGFSHNYFVSIANMEYNEAEKRIDVSLKLSAHDLEYLLEMKYNERLHLENIADSSEIGLYIQQYVKESFKVSSAGKEAEMNYLGREVTLRDELFIYLSFTGIKDPGTIHIENQLLFTLFAQQQNIVHYKYGELTKSVTLVPSAPAGDIKFE